MAIPRAREPVPPPLPPPTYIPEISSGQDPGWQWGNDPNSADFGRPASIKPGSSLLRGSAGSSRVDEERDGPSHFSYDVRRGSSISTITNAREREAAEDMSNHSDEDAMFTRPTSNGLQSERQLEQRTLEQSSHSYDKHLLSRIGGPNTPSRQGQEGGTYHNDFERRNSSLRPLTVPEVRRGSQESPSAGRWPSSGVQSPGFTGFWGEHGPHDNSRTFAAHRGSLTSEETGSHRGSYDHSMFIHDDFNREEGHIGNLNIHDRSPGSPKAGSKRRASSPVREREDRSSVSSATGHHEIYHRRSIQQLPNRGSPMSRFHPNHPSVSSASSGPRHGSLGSSLGLSSVPSSATSYASERISPGALSPAAEFDDRYGTPYGAPKVLYPTSPMAHHQRTLSESTQGASRKASTDGVPHARKESVPHLHTVYMCECCPKKPKKFDSEDELRAHESEKQYVCSYCPNRFKNKNEAERHQNSLHLRRHSWSCAALTGIEAAFHASSTGTDVCGYCGQNFPNPPQWDVRADHLNVIHKFGECNQSKKFYRADHFRQHLKHSHQGTSGKWTNMLENACMKDEPLPEPRAPTSAPTGAGHAPPALIVTTSGLSGSNVLAQQRINETPHDS